MDKLKIKYVPIDSVIPYERNPRCIREEAISAVAESIKDVGWQQPLVVDAQNVIIVGHTRRLAAMRLGLTEVPVVVAHLDDDQARRYRINDNKSGEKATWDYELMQIEMSAIDLTLPVMQANFSKLELEAIMSYEWEAAIGHNVPEAGSSQGGGGKKASGSVDLGGTGGDVVDATGAGAHAVVLSSAQWIVFQQACGIAREMDPNMTDAEVVELVCSEWSRGK